MKAYSEDLRKKITDALERGRKKSEVARAFGVGPSTVKRYVAMLKESGSLVPKKRPGKRPKIDQRARKLLETDRKQHSASSLSERRKLLERVAGVRVSEPTISRLLKRLGWSRKKRTKGGCERDEWLRAAWRALVAGRLDARRLVFVDEMGANTSLAPSTRGRHAVGEHTAHCRATVSRTRRSWRA